MNRNARQIVPMTKIFQDGAKATSGSRRSSIRLSETMCCGVPSDPITKRGRTIQVVRMMLLVVLPIIVLASQTFVIMLDGFNDKANKDSVRGNVVFSTETGQVVHLLQLERGISVFFLSSNKSTSLSERLMSTYRETDAGLDHHLRGQSWLSSSSTDHFKNVEALQSYIQSFRARVAIDKNVTITDTIAFYSNIIDELLKWVGISVNATKDAPIWKTLVAYHMLVLSKEQTGVERALGSSYFAAGGFDKERLLSYVKKKEMAATYFKTCTEYYPLVASRFEQQFMKTTAAIEIASMRKDITLSNITGPRVQMGTYWFQNMTKLINYLGIIQDDLAHEIVVTLEKEAKDSITTIVVNVLILIGICILCPTVLLLIHKMTVDIQNVASVLKEKTEDLSAERRVTDFMLYRMLPRTVADRLKNHQPIKPESFDHCTIYFGSIVGFKDIAAHSTAHQVIVMLNKLHQTLDAKMEMYDVYKVDTIGDASFMVASGVPELNAVNHVTEIATMALTLVDSVANIVVPHMVDRHLVLRSGFHSGACVAGVVGFKMPRYCLFGDTVTTASLMESTGKASKIQISEAAFVLLRSNNMYVLQARKETHFEGSNLKTWWLISKEGFVSQSDVTTSFMDVSGMLQQVKD
ncbi:unnamed protein product [Owenia fusiformis]|uniref:Guanylate cyclase domain-containing protein n=1 Tax=Owenia fusiformis TaxID=6347 RepID=A0A8S4NNZ1_OWEFU|nr:unnamed protein product [Owenia fusiformis]